MPSSFITPRLVITSGEPAGIGPDLCLKLTQSSSHINRPSQLIVVADPELLRQRAKTLRVDVKIKLFNPQDRTPADKGTLLVAPITIICQVAPGTVNHANSPYVIKMLEYAVDGCISGVFDGLVTTPVHKEVINNAGIPFSGHTEFLAQKTKTEKVVMMLATEGLRVALATTHLPLKDVAAAITRPSLTMVLDILHHEMQKKFSIQSPHILVSGLNPHAGEGGHLGMEEIDTIIPVLEQCRACGMNLTGPLPADTIFNPELLESADAVLAMYHDQGLPVLKFKGFGNAVNITLGLPIVRTSVDHGTALDRAGTGNINPGSLYTSINTALDII